jgi:hypothetical protein
MASISTSRRATARSRSGMALHFRPGRSDEPPARALLGELIADYWAEKLLAG